MVSGGPPSGGTAQVPQATPQPSSAQPYNDIFERLVAGNDSAETQLRGFVAYAYYKLAKREWVEDFCNKNGRQPNASELQNYIGTWTRSRIDGVVTEAEATTSAFAAYIVEKAKPDIVKEALQHRSFIREAGIAFVGALIYTVALILFAFLLKFSHIDLFAIFQNVGVTPPNGGH